MSVLLDMLWVPLPWLQWASAPPNNATVAQLAVHWSLFSLSPLPPPSQNHKEPAEAQGRLETGQRGSICDLVIL
ncbi:hypothetical protein PVAP13_1NG199595 [Panicum virgatum]|uniref:Secreted protein n=1 Tax=Panicum virgatum TaxID=38727 RepID=A0A8T0X0C5_PANVG|nr:hypothetical protein PVAP13_1NG199595 [Panicum virgatum]